MINKYVATPIPTEEKIVLPKISDIGTRIAAIIEAKSNRPKLLHSFGCPTDDDPNSFPPVRSRLAAKARLHLAKRDAEKSLRDFEKENGPRAEYHTTILYGQSEPIPVANIIDDPDFNNTRLHIDETGLANLQDSIASEGLKIPIIVVGAASPGYYYVRAGFRRTMAVRNLGWNKVPAIVLPSDMPSSEEHWINIIENTAREKLTAYELALAAQTMRDKFGVSIAEFARKTSSSPTNIANLLGCLERLPEEVLRSLANNDRVPLSIYVKLSLMTPLEAIRNLRLWKGQHRIDNTAILAEKALEKQTYRHRESGHGLSVAAIEKTQRLMIAIKTSKLPPETKQVALEIVEYIQGCRRRVEGVIHEGWRLREPAKTTEEQDFELMMETKIRELERENAGDVTPRRPEEYEP